MFRKVRELNVGIIQKSQLKVLLSQKTQASPFHAMYRDFHH